MDDLEGPYQLLSLASDKVDGVCVYILKIYLFTWKKEGEKNMLRHEEGQRGRMFKHAPHSSQSPLWSSIPEAMRS